MVAFYSRFILFRLHGDEGRPKPAMRRMRTVHRWRLQVLSEMQDLPLPRLRINASRKRKSSSGQVSHVPRKTLVSVRTKRTH